MDQVSRLTRVTLCLAIDSPMGLHLKGTEQEMRLVLQVSEAQLMQLWDATKVLDCLSLVVAVAKSSNAGSDRQ